MKVILRIYLEGGQIIELDNVEKFEVTSDKITVKQTNAKVRLAMIRPQSVIAATQVIVPNR